MTMRIGDRGRLIEKKMMRRKSIRHQAAVSIDLREPEESVSKSRQPLLLPHMKRSGSGAEMRSGKAHPQKVLASLEAASTNHLHHLRHLQSYDPLRGQRAARTARAKEFLDTTTTTITTKRRRRK
jgi:hypothetical protein